MIRPKSMNWRQLAISWGAILDTGRTEDGEKELTEAKRRKRP
jgi:hypothetical protein